MSEIGKLVLLGRGTGRTHADEIKSLGLTVGDTIRGKEGGDHPGRSWWHEVRLTVLWVGEKEVVYRKQWRANHHPEGWHDDSETANFTLSCREYYLEAEAKVATRPAKDGAAVKAKEKGVGAPSALIAYNSGIEGHPVLQRSFETFHELGSWGESQLTAKEPWCFDGGVGIRKYRITVEEIEEQKEVLEERLRKLWRKCDNHHHWQPLQAVAKQLGIVLTHEECGAPNATLP